MKRMERGEGGGEGGGKGQKKKKIRQMKPVSVITKKQKNIILHNRINGF